MLSTSQIALSPIESICSFPAGCIFAYEGHIDCNVLRSGIEKVLKKHPIFGGTQKPSSLSETGWIFDFSHPKTAGEIFVDATDKPAAVLPVETSDNIVSFANFGADFSQLYYEAKRKDPYWEVQLRRAWFLYVNGPTPHRKVAASLVITSGNHAFGDGTTHAIFLSYLSKAIQGESLPEHEDYAEMRRALMPSTMLKERSPMSEERAALHGLSSWADMSSQMIIDCQCSNYEEPRTYVQLIFPQDEVQRLKRECQSSAVVAVSAYLLYLVARLRERDGDPIDSSVLGMFVFNARTKINGLSALAVGNLALLLASNVRFTIRELLVSSPARIANRLQNAVSSFDAERATEYCRYVAHQVKHGTYPLSPIEHGAFVLNDLTMLSRFVAETNLGTGPGRGVQTFHAREPCIFRNGNTLHCLLSVAPKHSEFLQELRLNPTKIWRHPSASSSKL